MRTTQNVESTERSASFKSSELKLQFIVHFILFRGGSTHSTWMTKIKCALSLLGHVYLLTLKEMFCGQIRREKKPNLLSLKNDS